jgi:hypothetical protein
MTRPDDTPDDAKTSADLPEEYSGAEPATHSFPGFTKKPQPNHQRMLKVLRSMTPEQKLQEVFKLNERTRHLFRVGLRHRFPDLDEAQFEKLYVRMMIRCHNRNY